MQEARIVIGANFGDEGKGLMTDFFAKELMDKYGKCLVSCSNGGSQKGHTVLSADGIRHVFHHFGSGNFAGADTYLSKYFIVNPIIFNREYEELFEKRALTRTYVDKRCIVTLPTDMMINQLIEEKRGKGKHGSCGFGIFETILRSKKINITVEDLLYVDRQHIQDFNGMIGNISFDEIKKYIDERLAFLGIDFEECDANWKNAFDHIDDILDNFIQDVQRFFKGIEVVDDNVFDKYEGVVFEGAQGLLLDMNNAEYMPHLTPSNTGIKNPAEIITDYCKDYNKHVNTVCCYVTRSYMTRHGAGRFDTECKKELINADMYDMTNVPNKYQDTLRYGWLDLEKLRERMLYDIKFNALNIKPEIRLAVTHLNEFENNLDDIHVMFGDMHIYESYNENM